MYDQATHTELGRTGIAISRVGAGTWQWGDSLYWGYGRAYTESDVEAAYAAAREMGVNLFDTAEIYGRGKSEKLLGRFTAADSNEGEPVSRGDRKKLPPVISTKFFPWPWRLRRGQLRKALRGSLRRLGASHVDLYQTHFPLRPRSVETWVGEIADAHADGLVRAVGVSNYKAGHLRRAYELLDRRGIPLASNQIGFSLINRKAERNGVLAVCRELNVTVLAYGPIGEGILSGKYQSASPPLARRAQWFLRRRNRAPAFLGLMREIGERHGGASSAQVAINWCVAKGTVPLAGIKNRKQAEDNFAALGWRLDADEVQALDAATGTP